MFPIPLPIASLNLQNIPDETGFTASEKIALRHAWELIAPYMHSHAIDQFVEFFSENGALVDFFRNEQGEINIMELHLHKHKMFEFLELIIMDAIESLTKMHSNFTPLSTKHMECNVTMSAYKRLSDDLSAYLKRVLRRYMSPCLESGLDKLFKALQEAHEEKLEP